MGNMRILVVEDDFLARSLLSKMASEYGVIEIAVDGMEATEAVKLAYEAGTPFSLVFLDIMLPKKDGQTVLREIRDFEANSGISAPEACKVIMTTALSDAKNVMTAFSSQCEAYITKPFTKQDIDKQIHVLFPDLRGR